MISHLNLLLRVRPQENGLADLKFLLIFYCKEQPKIKETIKKYLLANDQVVNNVAISDRNYSDLEKPSLNLQTTKNTTSSWSIPHVFCFHFRDCTENHFFFAIAPCIPFQKVFVVLTSFSSIIILNLPSRTQMSITYLRNFAISMSDEAVKIEIMQICIEVSLRPEHEQ